MTNNEIIYSAAIDAGIYTQEQADAILASGHFLPLHTFQEWKARGYSVKKGEKAMLHVDLWKFTNKPPKTPAPEVTRAERTPKCCTKTTA